MTRPLRRDGGVEPPLDHVPVQAAYTSDPGTGSHGAIADQRDLRVPLLRRGIFLLPVNLYGPRDNFDLETGHVIPAMLRTFVTARYDGADPVNLGSGMEISMRDLAGLIARHVGYDGEIEWDATKPNGQPRRSLDTSRAKERFGFTATTPFDDGIQRTVEWWESGGRGRVRAAW